MASSDYALLLQEALLCLEESEGIKSDLDASKVIAKRKIRWAGLKKEVPNPYPAAIRATNYLMAMVMSMEGESL